MSIDAITAKQTVMAEDEPTTPLEANTIMANASQQSLPSTEAPASPAGPDSSLKPELNDDRAAPASVIPSSLTPPPSSQVPTNGPSIRGATSSQRQRMLSPPVTGLNIARIEATPAGLYTAPRPEQVVAASPDELRAMLQACIAEHTRLKTEAAHHKLQYQLLSVRADEDAHRAAVEQEMTLRQLEALRKQQAEAPRPARRELSAGPQITQAMYDDLKDLGEKALRNNDRLRKDCDEACKRLKAAKKLIVRQEEETDSLREENELLRNRLHDKRELWNQLASPGGMFHTPKTAQASPAQYRTTPRYTPKRRERDIREGRQEPFAVLLQAATQENSSAPSTPATPIRSGGRHPLKHSRGAQSLSSLPATPNNARPRDSDLLPAANLVPQTEPPRRVANRSFVPETPEASESFARERPARGRHSRESTISADDNQELARAALQSVALQATSFASRGSPPTRPRVPLPSHRSYHGDDGQVFESQASQEASAMLRRDPRESFEVASSRDATPAPIATEGRARTQSTLRGPLNKPGLANTVKRKFNSTTATDYDARREEPTSPTKRLRLAGGLREGNSLIGLGIRD